METITNTQDIIDNRDIIERIEELEKLEKEYSSFSEQGELEFLRAMVKQAEGCGDFECGEGLIHEDYFTKYCEESCEDIGDMPADLPWYIASNIDWDGVAGDIKQDYMEIDFDGATYFMRV